jgi:hypothetical protein
MPTDILPIDIYFALLEKREIFFYRRERVQRNIFNTHTHKIPITFTVHESIAGNWNINIFVESPNTAKNTNTVLK